MGREKKLEGEESEVVRETQSENVSVCLVS